MIKPLTPKTLEIVETTNGKLRGFKQRDIYNFLGVQYGDNKRWQTATMVKPWKGIKNALQFGNRAFPASGFTPWDSCGVAHEAYPYDEDCLNLNIWTSSIDKKAKKPVMVWIHGGGFATGSAMEMQAHDGENLSRFGDVVVVGLNHRLNIFGFFDVSKFGDKYKNSANAGMSDLVLALKWVKENIKAFGGDPDNVLIYGQSGGGGKVGALMQIPEADGLFHKAVIMSGVIRLPSDTDHVEESNDYSNMILEKLLKKFDTDNLEVLETLEPEELLEAFHEVAGGRNFSIMGWRPIANEWYLGSALNVGITEHAKTVPVMIGSVISEMPLMRIFNKHDYTQEEQIEIVKECFPGQDVEKLISLFQQAWPNKCITDVIEIAGNGLFRPGDIEFADLRAKTASAPTYVYVFGHDFPQNGGRGAWHCSDIPIVFHNSAMYPENFHDGLLDGLEDTISGSWAAFAHNSDPNNKYLKVKWPPYKTDECATLIFDNECEVKNDFDRELVTLRAQMKLEVKEKYTKFKQLIN